MSGWVAEGWLLGLATGPYCLGACAPFMVPLLLSEGRPSWRGNARIIGQFLAGRLAAYALFGAIAGWLGAALRPHITSRLAGIAVGAAAVMLLAYALHPRASRWSGCPKGFARLTVRAPWLLGFLIGLNVCPPFLAGMARLVQAGDAARGATFFVAFFAGTALYTLPLLALSPFARFERLQRVGRLAAVVVGVWLLIAAMEGSGIGLG